MPNAQRYLVPLDFSETSLSAVRAARRLATASTEFFLLHSHSIYFYFVPEPFLFMPTFTFTSLDVEEPLWRRLEQIRRSELGDLDNVNCAVVFDNSPVNAICEYACKNRIDLVVMASRERSGISALFKRSVADRVVRRAPCPVLVVRPDTEAVAEHPFTLSLAARTG